MSKYKQRDRFLQTAYGISAAEWDKIVTYERFQCPICGKSLRTKPRPPVDHDHDTAETRGIICNQCNRALGKAQDKRFGWSPVCFLKAFLYLLEYPAKRALGYQPLGFAGKIGTKRYRKYAKQKLRNHRDIK